MEFIARQPIFNLQRGVVAYELLFRSSEENLCLAADLDSASRQMMGTAMLMGLDVLAGGQTIYVNCTEEMLCGRYATLFPAQHTVLEVLETVKPSAAVILACQELKSAGYRIALDDFEDRPEQAPLVEIADIIKVDFRLTSTAERALLVERYGSRARMLAEKVECHEEFVSAVRQGYSLFQGYFFCKPKMLSTQSVKSLNPQHMRILRLLGTDRLDFHEVETLIKSDPALCFRLLRYLNSAVFCFRHEVRSILEALILLGERELRKWLLVVSTIMAGSRNRELVTFALVRARFAELVAPQLGLPGPVVFLLGLLSLMDAILEIPLAFITEQLALPSDIRGALLGEEGGLKSCVDLVIAYESGDWESCDRLRTEHRVPMDLLLGSYCDAVKWTQSVVSS
jgi:c-di-GMP-related signal transduction protein